MNFKSQLLVLQACVVAFTSHAQTEIKEDVRYEENTHLSISALGLSLVIPPGWFGGVAKGSPFLVLADGSNEVTIILTSDEMEEKNVLNDLQRQIAIDEGLSISPAGTVKKDGKRWWGDYKIHNTSQNMKCYVEVRLGDFGVGAGCIVVAFPSSYERGKNAAAQLLNSMAFTAPKQVKAVSGIDQPWNDYLKGKVLKYFYTQGDFKDTDFIHLCSNGTFTRSKSTVSGSATATGTMTGGDKGTWQANGQRSEGTLILTHQNGTRTEFRLQYREGTRGLGLYLNGYRYSAEASDLCH